MQTILVYSTCVPPPSTSVQDFIYVTAIYRVTVTVNYGKQKREWHEDSNDISDQSLGVGSSNQGKGLEANRTDLRQVSVRAKRDGFLGAIALCKTQLELTGVQCGGKDHFLNSSMESRPLQQTKETAHHWTRHWHSHGKHLFLMIP